MPKKLGINSKAVEAKARKDAQKQEKMEMSLKLKEDELWKDEDKHVMRKQVRKEEKEKKKQEVVDRKAINKAVYDEEMSALKSKKLAEEKASKVTRADIKEYIEKQSQITAKQTIQKELPIEKPIEENVNRIEIEGEIARNIEDAIAVLSTKETNIDRHPEKRLKAAFTAFEELNLPRLKSENPNLRLSQLKQILRKDWMKSPDNPLNQKTLNYNSKT